MGNEIDLDVDATRIRRLIAQYVPVTLTLDPAPSATDLAVLRHLAEAARRVDDIFWHQRSAEGSAVRDALTSASVPDDLRRLVQLGYGPWDAFDDDRPVLGVETVPAGGNWYPADLSADELDRYADAHPSARAELLSPTTLLRRKGDALVAVPYATAYRDALAKAASALERAAAVTDDRTFAAFLTARADGLRTGDLRHSEEAWVTLPDPTLDIAIGPYEVYDDRLLGLKRAFEATVLRRHPATDHIHRLEAFVDELDDVLPGAVSPREVRPRVRSGVFDVVVAAGAANMGAKAIAAMLPNDLEVRRSAGARLLVFRNVVAAKFRAILAPLAERVLAENISALIDEDTLTMHTLFHELAHALVDEHPGGSHEQLRDRYSTIEECRADLVAVIFIDHLVHRGALNTQAAARAVAVLVAGSIRVLRFGAGNDYGRAATIVLDSLARAGALRTGAAGKISVDTTAALAEIRRLALRVQNIRSAGDYSGAAALIAEARVPAEVTAALRRLDDLPVDLEFSVDPRLAF